MKEHFLGGCQRGAVAFDADLDLNQTMTCNCSRCQSLGAVLAFAPQSDFRLLTSAENLTEYRFNKKEIAHLFCRTCGIQSFSYSRMPEGAEIVAVNINTLAEVDPRSLKSSHFDGCAM